MCTTRYRAWIINVGQSSFLCSNSFRFSPLAIAGNLLLAHAFRRWFSSLSRAEDLRARHGFVARAFHAATLWQGNFYDFALLNFFSCSYDPLFYRVSLRLEASMRRKIPACWHSRGARRRKGKRIRGAGGRINKKLARGSDANSVSEEKFSMASGVGLCCWWMESNLMIFTLITLPVVWESWAFEASPGLNTTKVLTEGFLVAVKKSSKWVSSRGEKNRRRRRSKEQRRLTIFHRLIRFTWA
jgi:hypothetical protein